jgi:FkbM family methyltransferase
VVIKQSFKSLLISSGTYRPVRLMRERYGRFRPYVVGIRTLYKRFVSPGDLCFDIGAHIGHRSNAMLWLGASVVGLEPNPAVFRELMAYLGGHPNFHGIAKAVGSAPGKAVLRVGNWSEISTLCPEWSDNGVGWAGAVDIEVITLDMLIGKCGRPSFCKIDVEGYEPEVLGGLSQPIPTISFEYNRDYLDRADACLDRLRRFGPLRVNVSLGETHELITDTWWDFESFKSYLRYDLASHPIHFWGDIFVQFE